MGRVHMAERILIKYCSYFRWLKPPTFIWDVVISVNIIKMILGYAVNCYPYRRRERTK